MSLACSMLVAIISLSLLLVAEVVFLIGFQIREEHRANEANKLPEPPRRRSFVCSCGTS
jgi:hypothetical protein